MCNKTIHFKQRMSQRGIKSEFVDFLLKFGVVDGDKTTLTKKDCIFLSQMFSRFKKTVDKMAEKGGYTLVANEESLITIYRVNSFNEAKAKAKALKNRTEDLF